MTAATSPQGANPGQERFDSPRDIRAALLPEEVTAFDAAYQRALQKASETLSFEALQSTLTNWRRIVADDLGRSGRAPPDVAAGRANPQDRTAARERGRVGAVAS